MEGRLIKYLKVNRREEKAGRPRLRWLKDVEMDLWETRVKRRRQQAVYSLQGRIRMGVSN